MNKIAISYVGEALGYEPQQEELCIACDSEPMARLIEVVSAWKFARVLTTDTTIYLGFIELKTEG